MIFLHYLLSLNNSKGMIMKTLVQTIAVLLFSIMINAQEENCEVKYRHFTGEVGRESVIIDLVVTNGEYHGNCVFPGVFIKEGLLEGMVKTQRLEGSNDELGVALITAYSGNQESGLYSGIFGSTFKGTFRNASSGISRSFSLTENYDESISFAGYCLVMDSSLIDSAGSPTASVELYLLLPDSSGTYELRNAILKSVFGRPPATKLPDDSILMAFTRNFFKNYIAANRDLYDGGHAFSWIKVINTYISLNRKHLIVYKSDVYGFTGGAHGMGTSRFLVFDLQENRKLELEDIFTPGYEEKLSNMLESSYRKNYFVNPEQSLSEAGLFENNIPPSENFFLTENGIGFYYNPYQIAPYAMGGITLSIKYNELLSLIKIDSPVMKLAD